MIKIVIDTNVVVSAIFWGGFPRKLLKLVHDGVLQQYATQEIINEYEEICLRIGSRLKIEYRPSLDLIFRNLFLVSSVELKKQLCEDPDDDIFIACALSSASSYIVSGDKLLLKVVLPDIEVVTVGRFMKIIEEDYTQH